MTPSALAFAAAPAGAILERSVSVRHIGGGGTLRLRSARLETESEELDLEGPASVDLDPGGMATWVIRFAPTDAEPDSGVFALEHNASGGGTLSVSVSTPAPGEALQAAPAILDFGVVAPGAQVVETIQLLNVGHQPVGEIAVALDAAASLDFSVGPPPAGPIAAGGAAAIEVTYSASGLDFDEATLTVSAAGAPDLLVPVRARELGPVLAVFPDALDFGAVPLGGEIVQTVAITNTGSGALGLESVSLAAGSDPAFLVEDLPAATQVAAGDFAWLDVSFAPPSGAEVGSAAGAVEVLAAGAGAPLVITLGGQRGAPHLTVEPAAVSFGAVAIGVATSRAILLRNLGETAVGVLELELTGAAALDVTLSPAGPAGLSLAAGQSATVTLGFAPADATATAGGELVITSDDPAHPELVVPLDGHAVTEATCEPALDPAVTSLGGVPQQTSLAFDVSLHNAGTGTCAFATARIDHCEAQGIVESCLDGSPSPHFALTGAPPADHVIGPGEVAPLALRFDAPQFTGGEDKAFDTWRARLSATVTDPSTGLAVTVPSVAAGWQAGPNLHADTGIPRIDVYPSAVDFGLVPAGCWSAPALLGLHSAGAIPVVVAALEWVAPCGDGFATLMPPPLPLALAPGQPAGVSLVFQAHAAGPVECVLRVHSNDPADPVREVHLSAETTAGGAQIEVFEGQAPSKVDVLFVVDDSGSMEEEQISLATNFDAFIHAAEQWETDFRIAVTTTDPAVGGALKGAAPVVTDANTAAFAENVLVGTAGSLTEQGLAAAAAALSGPFAPYLRPDATLVLVFVSDEDDQSPGPVEPYLAAYRSAKSGDDDLLGAFAIVGPPGGCVEGAGSASGGLRYIQAAEQTGGSWASICDPSFAAALGSFGAGTFGPRTEFELSGAPAPGSVTVTVGGEDCAEGWSLAGAGRTVHFDSDSPCLPDDGDDVTISYELLCLR